MGDDLSNAECEVNPGWECGVAFLPAASILSWESCEECMYTSDSRVGEIGVSDGWQGGEGICDDKNGVRGR